MKTLRRIVLAFWHVSQVGCKLHFTFVSMPSLQKHILKQILKTADQDSLSRLLPECNNQAITELRQMLQQYRLLTADINQKQDISHILSRKIGETKKRGAAIDTLVSDMRATSKELKKFGKNLQALEDKILNYIPVEGDPAKTQERQPSPAKSRCYVDIRYDDRIQIDLLTEDAVDWNRYVDNHPSASVYHLAQWRNVICDSFGHEAFYFYAHDANGNIKGILPLIRLKSRLFGDFMVSMPYFNYGGAIGDHPTIEENLIRHANQLAANLGLSHIEYRDDISMTNTPERIDKVNMILPLPANERSLWQSFTPKLRSQIKRPQRENTRTALGGQELLDDFYNVFARNMRDLGTPVYGKAFFANILASFTEQTRILTVYLDNRPVAGAFLIGYKETLEIPWASTVRSANHLSVNMLMYWEVLRFAIGEKYSYFDFGRSSMDSGTYKFKKQWGAQAKQLYWHYWLNNCEIPSLNPSNPKYNLMINIWKKLPIRLTRLIGPMIVKNLP